MCYVLPFRELLRLSDVAPQSSSSGICPVDCAAITEPGAILVGRLERGMVKTQGMRDGL